MAIPVIVGNTTSVATSSSLTLTIPSGVENGDLLLILVGNDNGKAGEGFIDNTAGWTFHYSYGGGDGAYIGFYSKIADGTNEDSVTINSTDADDMYGWYLHITGQHATNPVRVIGSAQTGAASSVTISALTTDTNPFSLAFSQTAYDGADATFSESGTGWSMATPLTQGAGGTGASGVYSTKEIPTASTTTGTSVIGFGLADGYAATQFIIAGTDTGPLTYFDGIGTSIGEGIFTSIEQLAYNQVGSLVGEGILSSTEQIVYNGIGTSIGEGSLIASEQIVYNGTGISLGEGILTALGEIVHDAVGSVLGEGVFISSEQLVYNQIGSLLGTGIFIGDGEAYTHWDCSTLYDCSALMDCFGTPQLGTIFFESTGSLQGIGYFLSVEQLVTRGSGFLLGNGVLTGNGELVIDNLASIIGEGHFDSVTQLVYNHSGALVGEGIFISVEQLVLNHIGSIIGSGLFTESSHLLYNGKGVNLGQGILVSAEQLVDRGVGASIGQGVLISAEQILLPPNSGTLIGQGIFTGEGDFDTIIWYGGNGQIVGSGILSSAGEQLLDRAIGNLIGQGEFLGSAQLVMRGSGLLQGSGILTATSSLIYNGAGNLIGTGILTGSGSVMQYYLGIGEVVGQGVFIGDGSVYFKNTNFFALKLSAF